MATPLSVWRQAMADTVLLYKNHRDPLVREVLECDLQNRLPVRFRHGSIPDPGQIAFCSASVTIMRPPSFSSGNRFQVTCDRLSFGSHCFMEPTQTCTGSAGCGHVGPVCFLFFIVALKIPLVRAPRNWRGRIQYSCQSVHRNYLPAEQDRLIRSIMSGKTLSHDISTGGVYHAPGVFQNTCKSFL